MSKRTWRIPVILTVLLCFLLAFSAMAMAEDGATVCIVGDNEYTDLQQAFDENAADNQRGVMEVKLTADVKLEASLTLAEDKYIILDLNGYVLEANATADNSFSVIFNKGHLIIEDSNSAEQTHNYTVVEDTGLWVLDAEGKNSLSGGVITGGKGNMQEEKQVSYGGAVLNEGELILRGGNIIGNECGADLPGYGGAIANMGTFIMSDGNISGNAASNGGGVFNYNDCTFEMSGGIISNNIARYTYVNDDPSGTGFSGGVLNNGDLTMTGGSIENNCAAESGGGVSNYGTFLMENGKINGNECPGSECYGAGVDNCSDFTMKGGEISNNKGGGWGGGVSNYVDSTFTVEGGTFSNNTSTGSGGAVFNYGTLVMSDSLIYGNTALGTYYEFYGSYGDGCGGGICNFGEMELTGVKIYDNTGNYGGGLENGDVGNGLLINCSIYNNTASYIEDEVDGGWYGSYGGGIHLQGGELTLKDTSVTGNKVLADKSNSHGFDYCGGGIDYCNGTLILSGKVVLENNTANGYTDNLYMEFLDEEDQEQYLAEWGGYNFRGNMPIIIEGTLSEGSHIGVSHLATEAGATPVVVSEDALEANTAFFFSDDKSFKVAYEDNDIVITEASVEDSFSDVKTTDYFYDAVSWAVSRGITGGVDATHFAPNATTTRAQMITFLWRASGSPVAETEEAIFTDVSKDAYYYQAVQWGYENGFIKGTAADKFSPEAAVTRADALTFLYRYAAPTMEAADEAKAFTDVAEDSYYYEAVAWGSAYGIANGTSENTFSPKASCSRAQIVSFIYRFFNK